MAYGDAMDRTWEAQGGTLSPAPEGYGGGRALRVQAPADRPAALAPKSFFRSPGVRHYSLVGRIRAETPVELEALVQQQLKGSSRAKALETAPHHLFGAMPVPAGDWQDFRFDIDLGAEAERLPLRPLLRTGSGSRVLFDDVALIAWDDDASAESPGPGHSHATESR